MATSIPYSSFKVAAGIINGFFMNEIEDIVLEDDGSITILVKTMQDGCKPRYVCGRDRKMRIIEE